MDFSFRLWLEQNVRKQVEEDVLALSPYISKPQLATIVNWLIPRYQSGYKVDANTLRDIEAATKHLPNGTADEANFAYYYYKATGYDYKPILGLMEMIDTVDPDFMQRLDESYGPLLAWIIRNGADLMWRIANSGRSWWHDVLKEFWYRVSDHPEYLKNLASPNFTPVEMEKEIAKMQEETHKVKVISVDDATFNALMKIPGLQERGTADKEMVLGFKYEPMPGEGIYFKSGDRYLLARVLAGPKKEGDKWRVKLNFQLYRRYEDEELKGYSDGYNGRPKKNPNPNVPFLYERAYKMGHNDIENGWWYGYSFKGTFKDIKPDIDCNRFSLHRSLNGELIQPMEDTYKESYNNIRKEYGLSGGPVGGVHIYDDACEIFGTKKWNSREELEKILADTAHKMALGHFVADLLSRLAREVRDKHPLDSEDKMDELNREVYSILKLVKRVKADERFGEEYIEAGLYDGLRFLDKAQFFAKLGRQSSESAISKFYRLVGLLVREYQGDSVDLPSFEEI